MTENWALVAATAVGMLVSLAATIVTVAQRLRAQHKARLRLGPVMTGDGNQTSGSAVLLPSLEPDKHANDSFRSAAEDKSPQQTKGEPSSLPESGVNPSHEYGSSQSLAPDPDETIGYRATLACQIAEVTYRLLDYWARTGLVEASLSDMNGIQLYTFKDILMLKVVKRLLDTGVSLHNIVGVVRHLKDHTLQELANITLFSDGQSVYEAASAEEVLDLLTSGRGLFGIAVSGAVRELATKIADYPGEQVDGGEAIVVPNVVPIRSRSISERKIG